MSREKITVVGAGDVGAACARRLAEGDHAEIVLVDEDERRAGGTALDINQAGVAAGYEPRVTGSGGYEDTAGSDVCVIAVGRAPVPGTSAAHLLEHNMQVVDSVVDRIAERSPASILVVATGPPDTICHVALERSGFPRKRVLGVNGAVASARLRTLLAWELGVSVRDVTALVVGGTGDSMVPVLSRATVAGATLAEALEPSRLEGIVRRASGGGAEVAGPLGGTAASIAPSAVIAEIVESILRDRMRVLPCAALCQGEYGIRDIFVGVPCRLGSSGIEEIVELELSAGELERLHAAAAANRELVAEMTRLRGR